MRVPLDALRIDLDPCSLEINQYSGDKFACWSQSSVDLSNLDEELASPERLYEEIIRELSTSDELSTDNSSGFSDDDPWMSDTPCSPGPLPSPAEILRHSSLPPINGALNILCKDLFLAEIPACPRFDTTSLLYPDYVNGAVPVSHAIVKSRDHGNVHGIAEPTSHVKPTRKGKKHTKIRQTPNRCIHLWQFLRDLLDNKDYCSTVISWTCREKQEFRLIDTKAVAELWGTRKNRGCMTYEKMARTMRYYYKLKILERVPKKRLHFRFGKARLWTKI